MRLCCGVICMPMATTIITIETKKTAPEGGLKSLVSLLIEI